MVQESTMICFDNSDFMRNGDMSPTRLQCQQEAVRVLMQYKLRSNPENAVGLLSMASNINVLSSLTTEDRKLLAKLHQIQIEGDSKVIRGIKTAHLVLKNRSNRNHKTRIVVFIGSPLDALEADYGDGEFVKLAKKLKKENVKVDFVLFGEATSVKNQIILDFVDTINGADGVGSNVVVVPGDSKLFEALLSSPVCRGEDGVGGAGGEFDFGIDADDDPELALALRVSLEEQRQRQQQAEAHNAPAAVPAAAPPGAAAGGGVEPMEVEKPETPKATGGAGGQQLSTPLKIDGLDPAVMSEEEQIQWALRMSMMNDLEDQAGAEKSTVGGGGITSSSSQAADAKGADGNLLQPVPLYPPSSAAAVTDTNKNVDDEVLSSAGATASGTPAPTPMEADEDENKDQQHSNALGRLMDNPDLLQQLVDQIPEGGNDNKSTRSSGSQKNKGGKE